MTTLPRAEPTLTELDHVRLQALPRRGIALPAALQDLLDNADVVPSREVPADVVTLYTRLQLAESDARMRPLVVCQPEDAEPEAGFISVLSPLGTALLGHRAGDTVAWVTPDGHRHAARIAALDFQPEASGDYVT
jgi:regulator of nucleoside diphosphate kinase